LNVTGDKYYIVLRKPTNSGFFYRNVNNPTSKDIQYDLTRYDKIYVLNTFESAQRIAELFFHQPRRPKVGGSYGLIVEVGIEFDDMPFKIDVTEDKIFNNRVQTQKLSYGVKASAIHPCIVITPKQIKSIKKTYILDNVKTFNQYLQDTDFTKESVW
jgi:hypothetical protein